MCDTAVAVGSATATGNVIFAKNSDRPTNECQPLFHAPRREHAPGATVRCQYLEIPQARHTWEVVGGRPWWLWGFETGVNEWGVAIGNEAVRSKEPYAETGLLGMDLVRLGLERGRTAYEALRTIVELLERHGQGGSAKYGGIRYYHNAFIIADPKEAWVLETAGRYWAAERVQGARAISNIHSIETNWDEAHPELVSHAVEMGWCADAASFNFARAYGDYDAELAPRCFRFQRANFLMQRDAGQITIETMMAYLRDHYDDSFLAPRWAPQELCFASICAHSSKQYPGETASSFVAELRAPEDASPDPRAANGRASAVEIVPGDGAERAGDLVQDKPNGHRVGTTGAQHAGASAAAHASVGSTVWHSFASPCLSAFHPIYLGGVGVPARLDDGGETYDPASPWWRFERLHRRVDANPAIAPALQGIWRGLERRWLDEAPAVEARAAALVAAGQDEAARGVLRDLVDRSLAELDAAADEADRVLDAADRATPPPIVLQPLHRAQENAEAGLPPNLSVHGARDPREAMETVGSAPRA